MELNLAQVSSKGGITVGNLLYTKYILGRLLYHQQNKVQHRDRKKHDGATPQMKAQLYGPFPDGACSDGIAYGAGKNPGVVAVPVHVWHVVGVPHAFF